MEAAWPRRSSSTSRATKIKITVKRDDKEKDIEVTVGKRSEIFPKK